MKTQYQSTNQVKGVFKTKLTIVFTPIKIMK